MPAATRINGRFRSLAGSWIDRARGYVSLRELERRGMRVGTNVSVGSRTSFDYGFAWAISIGDDAIFAHDVRVIAHDASAKRSPLGYTVVRPVRVGARAYVGAGSVLLPGANIGDDAIIGAGSLVTGDIPAGMLAIGHPAKVIRSVDEQVVRLREQKIPVTKNITARTPTPEEIASIQAALAERGQLLVR